MRFVLYEKPSATLVTRYLRFHDAADSTSRLPIFENWLVTLSDILAKPGKTAAISVYEINKYNNDVRLRLPPSARFSGHCAYFTIIVS